MELPPSVHPPGEVRDLVDRILAEPRYDQAPESIPDRVLGWFADQIASVIGSLVAGGAGSLVAWAFVLGAIGGVVYLVVRFGRQPRVARSPGAPSARVMVELSRTAAEWRADAVSLEAAGRWRDALRSLHRALVADLVAQDVLSEAPGRTPREYARDVARARPSATAAMTEATDLFEAVWYGHGQVGAGVCDRFRHLDALVLAGEAVA